MARRVLVLSAYLLTYLLTYCTAFAVRHTAYHVPRTDAVDRNRHLGLYVGEDPENCVQFCGAVHHGLQRRRTVVDGGEGAYT